MLSEVIAVCDLLLCFRLSEKKQLMSHKCLIFIIVLCFWIVLTLIELSWICPIVQKKLWQKFKMFPKLTTCSRNVHCAPQCVQTCRRVQTGSICLASQQFRTWRKGGNDLELRLCIIGVAQHVRTIRSHTLWMGLPQLAVWWPRSQTCSPQPRREPENSTFKNRANGRHPLRRIYIEA